MSSILFKSNIGQWTLGFYSLYEEIVSLNTATAYINFMHVVFFKANYTCEIFDLSLKIQDVVLESCEHIRGYHKWLAVIRSDSASFAVLGQVLTPSSSIV